MFWRKEKILEDENLKTRIEIIERKIRFAPYVSWMGEYGSNVDVDLNLVVEKLIDHLGLRFDLSPAIGSKWKLQEKNKKE